MSVMKLKRQLLIQRRGAMLALMAITTDAGAELREKLPSFWDTMFCSVTTISGKLNFLVC